ncbi:NAD(P)/FAD-dependent oxidoreductase [Nocardioides pyridinolyticus]
MRTREDEYDVVVVGARCAGAATARILAERGLRVALLDRGTPTSDTLSTHAIARGGVVQLDRWGLLDHVVASGAPPIREVSFRAPGLERVLPVKDRSGVDHLVAPRRHVLDAILADAAVAAGAELRTGTTVTDLLPDDAGRVAGVRAGGRTLRARHVVGADGLRSPVARLVGAPVRRGFSADVSTYYAYVVHPSWRGHELDVAEDAFSGAFPTHGGAACVWTIRPTHLLDPVRTAGSARPAAFVDVLDRVAPALAERARTGELVAPVRGAVSLPNHVRAAYGPGWALVGDAGYHRDPITGHGITDAFRDAELLADAIVADDLPAYERERDRALDETFQLTEALARFPEPARFVELQVELAEALDREAADLASRFTHQREDVA